MLSLREFPLNNHPILSVNGMLGLAFTDADEVCDLNILESSSGTARE